MATADERDDQDVMDVDQGLLREEATIGEEPT